MRLQEFLLSEGIEDKGIFKAVFMAGPPGAGKTFVLNSIKSGQIEPRWVNTDKTFLSKDRIDRLKNTKDTYNFFRDHWNFQDGWQVIRNDVKQINKSQLTLYINSMLPLAVDGTSNSISFMNIRRGLLEGFGYDTAMVFVNTDLETSLKRAAVRDRLVQPEVVKGIHDEVMKAKSYYKTKFSDFIEIDNNDGELTQKTITKAFKVMDRFYSAPVENPVGKTHIKDMKENGWKYLSPHVKEMSEIKKMVSIWYRST